ncbi:MAG: acyl-CoA synthetase [Alphaproteobacteria bacterium HGW-Alphaproteobacteria-18]|nr:MAG: acyl-CoA synthetase [Alphaproteobacteria bacterium HGW-Alphaproteobacteria-18]
MHPRVFALSCPGKTALVFEPSGRSRTYADLEVIANKGARLFRQLGISRGDKVAFCLENCPEVYDFCWAAQRAGLYYVPVSSRLTADEIAYILKDSCARLLLTSDYLASELDGVANAYPGVHLFKTGQDHAAYSNWDEALSKMDAAPIGDESGGAVMFYSSGTTGRQKGIAPTRSVDAPAVADEAFPKLVSRLVGASEDSIYLCPAPLYHAAPFSWTMSIQRLGATAVVMERFDPELLLSLVQKHGVTCAQFVPTHFVRILKLPEKTRFVYDVSSLKAVIHAAAPCPVPVKRAMIEWWGPIVHEYYAGSEGNGMTFVRAEEWLDRPGTVGRAVLGKIHICDDEGKELGAGEEGTVFFEGGNEFTYHNDPEKTAESRNRFGWSTLGDVGRLDEGGYLYLTDRKSFMIISGGVNIYPQEIENHLVTHPDVLDVAVIGGPDPDMGEKVIAVVQLKDSAKAGPEMASELSQFAREKLSGVKIPRQIDFVDALPRAATGKLYKRSLRDTYWQQGEARAD